MAYMKISLKKMKELQRFMGGRAKGFFIICYGSDIETGQNIIVSDTLARFERKTASADYYLVKGKVFGKK